jgi:hypothetical protein
VPLILSAAPGRAQGRLRPRAEFGLKLNPVRLARAPPRGGPAGKTHLALSALAAWALPREAALRCTTPDFTALSIAEA